MIFYTKVKKVNVKAMIKISPKIPSVAIPLKISIIASPFAHEKSVITVLVIELNLKYSQNRNLAIIVKPTKIGIRPNKKPK